MIFRTEIKGVIFIKDKLEGLLKQVDLYEELLDIIKEEIELLQEGEDISELQEKERELRDDISDIDTEYHLSKTEKLRLISDNDIEELNRFEPLLRELYEMEQKTEKLKLSS
ncbi:MAG: flagellar biosynthesis protein FlgN [Halanaerobacter sp.]